MSLESIKKEALENHVPIIMDDTLNKIEEFLKEKAQYIELLKKRSELFLSEAKAADLPLYAYEEGFFITLKVKDNETRDLIHERLLNDHIYAVPVNKGIRIAICSIPLEKIKGLAQRIKKAF